MRKVFLFLLLGAVAASGFAQRYEEVLTQGWCFKRGAQPGAEQYEYNDALWSKVTVPHDYAIGGPFSRDNDLQDVQNIQNKETKVNRKTGRTGGLPYYGEAWYRRKFKVLPQMRTHLYFDGAMSEATVYVNGKQVAFQPNGYAAFGVDITHFVRQNSDNQLAIHLDSQPYSSRWYPGAGLFREVKLIHTSQAHAVLWGSTITTPVVRNDEAKVDVNTCFTMQAGEHYRLQTLILDSRRNVVAEDAVELKGEDSLLVKRQLSVKHPRLWSPESPYCYQVLQRLYHQEKLCDEVSTVMGIRTIEFRKQWGFYLNGNRCEIKGVCIHHDLGALGAAVNESAIRYRLAMLKDMGCNAIRTTHNLPSSLLPRLCDELGFMLFIEPFDEWDTPKCQNGFHRYFADWAERQVRDMVRHFRNHPSVILWGIGNEVPNQRDAEGYRLVERLQQICHEEDSTRRVSVCMDQIPYVLKNGFARQIDIPGINYNVQRYEQAFATWSQGLILGSETASTVSSRGVYKFPVELKYMAMYPDHQSSGYDVECCSWSNTPDADFGLVEAYPWYIGQFVWTGFDYLGEPTPYNNDSWPNHSSLFGIIDLANLPKDRYYLYRSVWNKREHTLHVLPHWTWPGREGETTPVMVYTDYPEAELFVNGVSQGRIRKRQCAADLRAEHDSWNLLRRYRLIWDEVKYQPGELKVLAYNEAGMPVDSCVRHTAGVPVRLVAVADKMKLNSAADELAFITVSAVDKDGHLVPQSAHEVKFKVEGCGEFRGVANGDPTDLHELNQPLMPLFGGKLMAIVGAKPHQTGHMKVLVTASGVQSCEVILQVE